MTHDYTTRHKVRTPSRLDLPDGASLIVRPIRRGDERALQRLYGRLSPWTIYLRFLTVRPTLTDEQAHYFAHVDHVRRVALVVQDPAHPAEVIAVARYDRDQNTARAELAVVVEDRWQGRRIGSLLIARLIDQARHGGVESFYGAVAFENTRILHVLRRLGLPLRVTWDGYIKHVDLSLSMPA